MKQWFIKQYDFETMAVAKGVHVPFNATPFAVVEQRSRTRIYCLQEINLPDGDDLERGNESCGNQADFLNDQETSDG